MTPRVCLPSDCSPHFLPWLWREQGKCKIAAGVGNEMWDGEPHEGSWPLWGWKLYICFLNSEKGKWKQTLWDRIWTRSEWRKARKRKGCWWQREMMTEHQATPPYRNSIPVLPWFCKREVCAWVTIYCQRGIRDLETESTWFKLKRKQRHVGSSEISWETMKDPRLLNYFWFQTLHSSACVFA